MHVFCACFAVVQVLKAPAGKPFFYKLVDTVVASMGNVFPELKVKVDFVKVRPPFFFSTILNDHGCCRWCGVSRVALAAVLIELFLPFCIRYGE